MRTRVEIQLMSLRQRHFDEMAALRAAPVVNLRAFKFSYVMYKTCDYILREYRETQKYKDVA